LLFILVDLSEFRVKVWLWLENWKCSFADQRVRVTGPLYSVWKSVPLAALDGVP